MAGERIHSLKETASREVSLFEMEAVGFSVERENKSEMGH